MLLVKCSCKCFFTIKEDRGATKCPNCSKSVDIYFGPSLGELEAVAEKSGMSIQKFPDEAKINISFDL